MTERSSAINPVSILQRQSLLTRLSRGGMQALLLLLLVTGLASCEKEGALLAEPEYRSALVGQWQGTVGDESESIRFEEDGSFSSQVRSNGFISATLGQGTAGKVDGSWTLRGSVINLAIDQVSNERPLNLATVSTIVSFHQNQLVMKSDSGETSTFVRAM